MNERRKRFRLGLHSLYLPVYDAICAELPIEWDPCQGLRTVQYQDGLWEQGRSIPGPGATKENPLGRTVTNARGGESPHNYGCATDWIIWEKGQPVWIRDTDPRWKVYFDACAKAGAKLGADFGDLPHNELRIRVRWTKVFEAYMQRGAIGADEMIRTNLYDN